WIILDYDATQTTRDQLEAAAEARRKARDKKRRQRSANAAVPGDVPRDITRPGQARPGQAPRDEVPGLALVHDAALNGATPSQTRKRVHDGPENDGPDVQHDSTEVQRQSQATDRYAREGAPQDYPRSQHWTIEGFRIGVLIYKSHRSHRCH